MKQKKHTTEEIIRILREADNEQRVESVNRDLGLADDQLNYQPQKLSHF